MSLELIPAVHEILDKVKTLTGKEVRFVEKKDHPSFASIKVARKSMEAHLLLYKPERSGLINHLVAHECGHVLRMYAVPVEKRLIPRSDSVVKKRGLIRIQGEIDKLSSVLPIDKLDRIVNMWYDGLVSQVINQPPDIMIEKWLYIDYPALRHYQQQSIQNQRREALAGLSDRVAQVTPPTIVDASNIMNYAFFKLLGETFGVNYVGPYRQTPYIARGGNLAKVTQDCPDYDGDVENIKNWAEFLGISGWFEWAGFEDVPENYDKIA